MHRTQKPVGLAIAEPTPADILRRAARLLGLYGRTWGRETAQQDGSIPAAAVVDGLRAATVALTEPHSTVAVAYDRVVRQLANTMWRSGLIAECDYYGSWCLTSNQILINWLTRSIHSVDQVVDLFTAAAAEADNAGGVR
ncbi:DUF6197 family protein [Rugosimonospora africana]|uniref:Uncharacterized protein n=1 Tax=Rugosimonospora africana TaxID=556532 RepID=A0A8J3QSA5_9ACTN|nr:hypothetical protein [Rugosimonospora africana]GIH14708.1 hypothetical protein Raf01_28800 [Rugosimonospora africana]